MSEKNLKNKDYVFTLLTAVVKKEGGEVRLTEEEMCRVTKQDVVKLLWDQKKNEVVIQVADFILPLSNNDIN